MRTLFSAIAAVAMLFVAAACSSTQHAATPSSTTPPPATTTTAAPPATTTATPPSSMAPPASSGAPAPAPSTPPRACADTAGWGTGAKEAAGSTTDALYLVRAGQHDCYDRVVFDINGPGPVGYSVGYVPVVPAEATGAPITVAGGAALQVVVRAPEQGFDSSGHQPGRILATTGDYFYTAAQLAGWTTLRAVRFAGFFEGQCTIAVGVRARLPFRVFTLLDTQDQVRRVVVDIAH